VYVCVYVCMPGKHYALGSLDYIGSADKARDHTQQAREHIYIDPANN
jgi:hypothetical protein